MAYLIRGKFVYFDQNAQIFVDGKKTGIIHWSSLLTTDSNLSPEEQENIIIYKF